MRLFKKRSFKFLHSSNETKATFPLNHKTYTYDAKYYRPYMTNNKLTQIEIHSFFQEIAFATNNFAYLRVWKFSTIFLSSLIFLVNLLLFILYSSEISEEFKDYITIHPHSRYSVLFIGFGMILVLNIIGFLAKIYSYRKARSTIESLVTSKSNHFGNKRLKWELDKKSIDYIILYNLDMDLETSFEIEYEDIESSKNFSQTDIQRSLLTEP